MHTVTDLARIGRHVARGEGSQATPKTEDVTSMRRLLREEPCGAPPRIRYGEEGCVPQRILGRHAPSKDLSADR